MLGSKLSLGKEQLREAEGADAGFMSANEEPNTRVTHLFVQVLEAQK